MQSIELTKTEMRPAARSPWPGTLILIIGTACFLNAAIEDIPSNRAQQIQLAAPAKGRVAPVQPRRVLIWNTPPHLMEKDPHKGYCIPYGAAAFRILGEKTHAFEPVISDDLAAMAPENLRKFDAIILNNASGPWITPTDADMRKEPLRTLGGDKAAVEQALRNGFLSYVRNGGGVVSVHFAVAANRHWPEFKELFGATFTGHPWNEEIAVTVEEPEHPLLASFGGRDFRIADEIYEYGPPFDRSSLRVLLSLDPAHSNMGVKWIHRKDNDFALAWIKKFGDGRVLNCSFGHRTEIYWDPRVLAFYLDAIQFATGDIKAPVEPRPAAPRTAAPGTQPVPGLDGFVSLFNGTDLRGWIGDSGIWRVENGAIVGETTADIKVKENTFLVWKNEVEDFELRLKFKLEGGNSGIYYRARKRPANQTKGEAMVGTQADFSADGRWSGVIMEYTLREVLAERGQQVSIDATGRRTVTGSLGDPAELLRGVRTNDWNNYSIVARGGHVTLAINGVAMSELHDNDPKRLVRGWLALQVHAGPAMRVSFKDVYLRRFPDR